MKAYLDTNVIIRGSGDLSNYILKEMVISGKLHQFISPEIYSEQQARSLNHYFGEQAEAIRNVRTANTAQELKKLHGEISKQDILQERENKEWEFWKECAITHAKSTFAGLMIMAGVWSEEQLLSIDIKREIDLYTKLIRKYKITSMDAAHLMHAHSAEIKYFLTYDRPLIKKAKKAEWLFPNLYTPDEFVAFAT
ncbi:MAG: hypothetical protein WC527_00215 [Candidatus Margulisiibacteriota bacterium]